MLSIEKKIYTAFIRGLHTFSRINWWGPPLFSKITHLFLGKIPKISRKLAKIET